MFSVYNASEKLRRRKITGHFGFVFDKLCQENHMIIVMPSLSESSVFKVFSLHTKTKIRRFQIPTVCKAFVLKKFVFMH